MLCVVTRSLNCCSVFKVVVVLEGSAPVGNRSFFFVLLLELTTATVLVEQKEIWD